MICKALVLLVTLRYYYEIVLMMYDFYFIGRGQFECYVNNVLLSDSRFLASTKSAYARASPIKLFDDMDKFIEATLDLN